MKNIMRPYAFVCVCFLGVSECWEIKNLKITPPAPPTPPVARVGSKLRGQTALRFAYFQSLRIPPFSSSSCFLPPSDSPHSRLRSKLLGQTAVCASDQPEPESTKKKPRACDILQLSSVQPVMGASYDQSYGARLDPGMTTDHPKEVPETRPCIMG